MNTDQQKWIFLRDAPARDAQSEEMRAYAQSVLKVAGIGPWPRWLFANLAHCIARDGIVYMSDIVRTGGEQIDGFTDPQGSTLASLERGTDDCDAKARLFVALCLAVGLPARMVPRWRGSQLSHVSAEVYVQGPLERASRWWPVETILDRARIGDVAESIPLEPTAPVVPEGSRRWAQMKFEDLETAALTNPGFYPRKAS